MKIGILSFRQAGKRAAVEELRLLQAAKALGHQAFIFRSDSCQLFYDEKNKRVLYNFKRFPKIDVLIPRARVLKDADIRLSLVRQFEEMGIPVVNFALGITRAKNKVHTQQILHQNGIRTPQTVVIENLTALSQAIDMVGGAPVILKDPYGSFGAGVVIAETKRAAKSALGAIWNRANPVMMVQEYIAESGGKDTRVFVVGGRVLAAMERSAQAEEFRSNVELGGETRAVEISKEYEEMALAATEALGLEVSGVDIIETSRGPAVLEVNSNPGFKALELCTGVDVAGAIIEYAVLKASGQN